MNQRIGRYLALMVLLGVVGAVSAVTLKALGREPDASVTKVNTAERIIGYQVFPDRGPAFRLRGTRLKLVSNVVVEGYDPQRVTAYGFRLVVRDGGRELWRGEVFLQSRESKARWDGRRWRDEAAWGVTPIGLTDERIAILNLPDRAAGATLSITLLGTPHEAVIRLFGDEIRSDVERQSALSRIDPGERNELIRSSTYIPWQLLAFTEQFARLTHRWVRMAALGDSGSDVTTRTIYVTDFRLSIPPPLKEGIEVARGHDVAINVQGPAHMSLAALSGSIGDLEVTQLNAAGEQRLRIDEHGGIEAGEGPGTLIVRTARAEPMRFRLAGPVGAKLASEHAPPVPPGELVPDQVNVSLVACGDSTPVILPVPVVDRMPLLGRGIRIDARVVVTDEGDPGDSALSPLFVAYVSATGKKLRVDRVVVGGLVSRFERLSVGGGFARVTEPSSLRVVAPPGAARIELTAERDVVVRAYRWVPGEQMMEPPYRDIAVPELRWRYARLIQRSWFPMAPVAPVDASLRPVQLEAQVRLEPILPSENPLTISDYQALVPEGHPEQQRAREPIASDELAEVLTAWPTGSRTRIGVGADRILDFRPTIVSRPRLSWIVDPSAVGSELVVTVDEQRIPVAITSTVGAVNLPRITPGRHRVRLEGSAREVWIDRPPVDGGAGVSRDRTLYRLTKDGIRVRVLQRAQESVHVYAIVYAPSPSASQTTSFVMTVDGGRVARRNGLSDKLTSPEVNAPMPAARRTQPAVLIDLANQSAGVPRSLGIGILSDLAGGWHTVALRRTGSTDVWVRFVTTRPVRDATRQASRVWASGASPVMERLSD